MWKSLSGVWLIVAPWTIAWQAPLSSDFSRSPGQYWSRSLFPSPGNLPNAGIKPRSPTLQAHYLQFEPPSTIMKSLNLICIPLNCFVLFCFVLLPWCLSGKESTCQCRRCRFSPWVGNIPWKRTWQPTSVFLLGESQVQRSLAGYSP